MKRIYYVIIIIDEKLVNLFCFLRRNRGIIRNENDENEDEDEKNEEKIINVKYFDLVKIE